MADKPKRRRIFGPLTYGVLIASVLVYVGFRLEPWVHKQLRCRTLLSELRTATGPKKFWDKAREFSVFIDPSTSNWIDVAIKDKNASVRALAYSLVPQAFAHPEQAYPRLIRAASDPEAYVQLSALRSAVDLSKNMNKIDRMKYFNKYMKMFDCILKNPDPSTRIGALDCLTSLPLDGGNLEDTVSSMIDDRLDVIRLKTIYNIGKFKKISPRVKKLLESKLEDCDRSVRFAAAETLARFESVRSRRIDLLRDVFKRPGGDEIETDSIGNIIINEEYNKTVELLTANLGGRETIDFFVSMTRDSDPRVRVNGIEGLWYLGLNDQRFLEGGSSSRSQPIDLTPELFRTDRIAVLVSKLDDPDLRVAFAAAATLSSDVYSKYDDKHEAIDRVLRSVIANRYLSEKTRSDACAILIGRITECDNDLVNFFLKHIDRNDENLYRVMVWRLSTRGMAAKPAIPIVVKLASRFPMQVDSVRELLKQIDPLLAKQFFEERLRFNVNEFVEDEVPVENGDAPIPKIEE
jgi:HEAT repeat protein